MEWLVVWFEQHPGTASWVQAVGTLIALAVAVAVPLQQNYSLRRHAELRNHEQALQLYDSLGAMADFAGELLMAAHQELQDPAAYLEGLEHFDPRVIAGVGAELDRYPFYQLPDYESVKKALELKSSFSDAAAHLTRTVEAQRDGQHDVFLVETARFNREFDFYRQTVKAFSEQANEYRARIVKA